MSEPTNIVKNDSLNVDLQKILYIIKAVIVQIRIDFLDQ